ncbi:hypothetical protein [Clostridium botulinum]|nr:hypothetical protein [Clostridium botulinum]MBY6753145.1 hypothetical protein [Clostridium botulinum]MBY6763910.1 hypothetical protein [Clostridium botulinum]MBY6830697.1 hypothetical protein [Clostridium botulinum]MBY6940421.1 hypothetical protein [Clostridium botulinum]MBY6961180.1 hypothetical protein [Clostridium botulinum]
MEENKKRFMDYVNLRLKQKEYKKRLLYSDIADLRIKSIEKSRNRKNGQF